MLIINFNTKLILTLYNKLKTRLHSANITSITNILKASLESFRNAYS
jgi:hypothetical protein